MECHVGISLNPTKARVRVMDTLKGVALVIAFLGFLVTCATWIHIWDSMWQAAVEPTRGAIYNARLNRLGPSPCLRSSWMWWRTAGCRLIWSGLSPSAEQDG
jgi:hypothetical protein